jgi:hypothetical protein
MKRLVWLVALLMGPGAALLVTSAQAQVTIEHDANRFRSEQRWAIEVRFGPYKPEVDSEFNGAASPYQTYFGDERSLFFQAELDYQFLRVFGTLAVGAQVGYMRQSGSALTEAGTPSGDTTKLWVVPTSLQLVYRMDEAAIRLGIPLAPYVKAGLNYTLWRITDGNGNVARLGGFKARGATPGWQAAAGMALLLDFIDPASSRALDSETGLNHTYVFVEVARYEASGFGSKKALRLGDTTWCAGLMFEF